MKLWSALSFFFASVLVPVGKAEGQFLKNPCVYNNLIQKSGQEELLSRYKNLYGFKAKERVASVGAGGGSKEIVYSMMADSLVFYLQDIDSTCLIESKLRTNSDYLYNVWGKKRTAELIAVIGTAENARLPSGLDKVIMENTLHELSQPERLLSGIRKSLKSNGFLFIEDIIAEKPGQRHRGCKKRLYTERELIDLLSNAGFQFVESNVVYPANKEDRLYKFSLK